MKHPMILLVPALMLLDYLLTIRGAKAATGVYCQHFKSPHYELNPVLQESVSQQRWFSARHFVGVCLVSAMLVGIDYFPEFSPEAVEFLVGMLLGMFGAACGRHLNNLLVFQYLDRNPTQISGQVEMTHHLVLKLSLFNYLGIVPLLCLIALLEPSFSAIGALLGVLVLAFVHMAWGLIAKFRPSKAQQQADAPTT